MTRLAYGLLSIALGGFGCGGSLTGPDPVRQGAQPTIELAAISGRIYGGGPVEAPLGDAVVEVNEADGSSEAVRSDSEGFYRIMARRGSVTITASKSGYEAKQWQFDLLSDTVLNFSLHQQ